MKNFTGMLAGQATMLRYQSGVIFEMRRSFYLLIFIFMLCIGYPSFGGIPTNTRAKHGMVVSGHRLASEVGIEVLKQGGNAVDAAVAVGFALAVVYPEAGNIGGGGFAVIRMKDGRATFIDFREKAPKAASRNMYLDSDGNVTKKSVNGHLAAGVPGTVAGLVKMLEWGGTKKMESLIEPSIRLAENGFPVGVDLAEKLEDYKKKFQKFPSTEKIFLPNGAPLEEQDILRLPDLAATLKRIQQKGEDGFYRGETARLIVEEMKRGEGLITEDDLASYQAIVRTPLQGSYRGYEILTAAPPSSGGICLLEMLGMLEHSMFSPADYHSSQTVFLTAEIMKRVYADRGEYLGDPDFVKVPLEELLSKEYLAKRFSEIDTLNATPSSEIHPGAIAGRESDHTTHYSVMDEEGNSVSVTYTLNDLFGCKVIVEGAGFFLNDEMDDFSAKPGVPNQYGLIGNDANAIQPEKRPLSSMSPTILVKDGSPMLILGARGGSRIITGVLQAIVNVVDFKMNVRDAVSFPRYHHQYLPDTLFYEPFGLAGDVIKNLSMKGFIVSEYSNSVGQLEAIYRDAETGWMYSGSDPREGGWAVGY